MKRRHITALFAHGRFGPKPFLKNRACRSLPQYITSYPVNHSQAVNSTLNLQLIFNTFIRVSDQGCIRIKRYADDQTIYEKPVHQAGIIDQLIGTTYTTETIHLERNTDYYIQLDHGAISGRYDKHPFAGIYDKNTWRFRTELFAGLAPRYALSFDGTSQYAAVLAEVTPMEFTSGTISLWMKAGWEPGSRKNNPVLLSQKHPGGASRFSLHVGHDLQSIGIWDGEQYETVALTIPKDQWMPLAVTMRDGQMRIFFDGVYIGQTSSRLNNMIGGSNLRIGASSDGLKLDGFFQGEMDDIRIYSHIKTDQQLATEYRHAPLSNESLIAYYPSSADLLAAVNMGEGYLKDIGPHQSHARIISYFTPVVQTQIVTSGTEFKAYGTLLCDGGIQIKEKGFFYSVSHSSPDDLDFKALDLRVDSPDLQAILSEARPGLTYFVRAFATNTKGTFYGDVLAVKFEALHHQA